MKRFSSSLCILTIMLVLTACNINAGSPTPTQEVIPNTPTPTETVPPPTPTITETPTPSLPPEFLSQFQDSPYSLDGASIAYTPPGGEKLTLPGSLDATGFHLDLADGAIITIPPDQLASRIKVGPGDVLAIYDPTGAAMDYGYDKKDNLWVKVSMVSTELNTPEDFASLPVLDDKADFDSGKVQQAEYWLIDNVLPPANDIELPKSWSIHDNGQGFSIMDWNQISEPNVKTYRGDFAFFTMRDGKKMLKLGVEFGGPGQLIHFNFKDPRWWTDPVRMKTLIAAFNNTDVIMMPIVQYGNENSNWLTLTNGYLISCDASNAESYTKMITSERAANNNQFAQDWLNKRQLPAGADKTVFGAFFIVK